MKRYQECNRIEKFWRRRWYLLIPFQWLWHTLIKPLKFRETKFDEEKGCVVDTDNVGTIKGKELRSILKGKAQSKMRFYYTMEEAKKMMEERIKNFKREKQ